jgi:oxygen-independent coproporphyrinogen-3 oxidase
MLEDDGSLGVYVHVPFCERVCPYCDFPVVGVGRRGPDREDEYVEALLCELDLARVPLSGRRLSSVYLGGGTPSLLRPDAVGRIVTAVRAAFVDDGSVEVTLEANPGTTERACFPGFRDAGVDRLSLGVQSFDDGVLKRLGRAHAASEARAALGAARDAGFENVSLDLIFGAPGQSAEQLDRDLDEVVAFGPEHVSAYELTIEAATPFALAARRGQLALPDEDAAVRMFERVGDRLEAAGLSRYEISSFAVPGRQSVHNRRYWERRPVLGLGLGAWSFDPPEACAPFGARRGNPRGLADYLGSLRRGVAPQEGPREVLDPATARGEAVFLALRTVRGLDVARFSREFGGSPRHFYASEIDALEAGGLLEEDGDGRIRLSGAGRLVSDSVFERFVAASPPSSVDGAGQLSY